MEKSKKWNIAIIGAGDVGATTAYTFLLSDIPADIILIDIDEQRCKGELFDLNDAAPFGIAHATVKQGTFVDARSADIIVIAAGARQKPNQKRTELIAVNKEVISSIFDQLNPVNPDTIVLMVTNPVDIMTQCALQKSNLSPNKVMGTGTCLDTKRLTAILSKKLHIAESSIDAYILGEHGDSQFPVWSHANSGGVALTQLCTQSELDAVAAEVKNRAYEIIACKGATYFSIAACVVWICDALLYDKKQVLPISSYHKELGVCLSMPTVIGKKGIERVLPISLSDYETQLLKESVAALSAHLHGE